MVQICASFITAWRMKEGRKSQESLGISSHLLSPYHSKLTLSRLYDFFRHCHLAFALFDRTKFLQQFEDYQIPRDLLQTILLITQQVLHSGHDTTIMHPSSALDVLNESTFKTLECWGEWITVDVFQQACLLTYYDFHQNSGPNVWMKAGQLTRQAYRYGLNELDDPDQCALYSYRRVDEDEIEEWRKIWWFIYCLDSYSNTSSGMPFIIELGSIRTALVGGGLTQDPTCSHPATMIFLPNNTGDLWETLRNIIRGGRQLNFNIHMVTTTLLREANRLHRLHIQSCPQRVYDQITALKEHISAVRLALPSGYLSPSRNTLIDESQYDHHARLVCVLHLHLARLLLVLPPFQPQIDNEWFQNWCESLASCQDIAAVVQEWDSTFTSATDPAICLAIIPALLVLQLHNRCGHEDDQITLTRIASNSNVLLLFLDQFSSLWSLPRVLKGKTSAPKYPASVTDSLSV